MSGQSLRVVVTALAAFLVAGITAFLTAGPALLADGPFFQRIVALAVSVAIFFLLGLIAGALAPEAWKLVALIAVVPVVAVAVLFIGELVSSPALAGLAAAFVVGDAAAVLFGSWAGSGVRARRDAARS